MCIGSTSLPGVREGHKIVRLQFQARLFGNNTDDLTCYTEDEYGNRARVLLQMKRTLHAKASDDDFSESLGLAWLDYRHVSFQKGVDRFNIIYDVVSAQDMKAAAELARDAKRSTSSDDWVLKATAPNFSNDARRNAFASMRAVVESYNGDSVSDAELHSFLQHVEFLAEDLDADDTTLAKELQEKIGYATRFSERAPLPASTVWAKLVSICVDLNGCAGDVDTVSISQHLDTDLDQRFKAFALGLSLAMPKANLTAAAQPTGTSKPLALGASPSVARTGGDSDLIPAARDSSINKIVSKRLNRVADLIKACRFADAQTQLQEIKQDADGEPLDAHQQARWHSMYGSCVWLLEDDTQTAAAEFIKAAELFEEDDKLAAARVRGLMLQGHLAQALQAGQEARERFPSSLAVWVSWSNARIVQGEKVTEADIPAEHADKAVAYQIAAAGLRKSEDLEGALAAALKALEQADASFFAREAALRYALELVGKNPVGVVYRTAPAEHLRDLRRAADAFQPRASRLWSAQAKESVTAAALHLSYAYLLLKDPEEALAISQEAEQHNVDHNLLLRTRMEALCDLDRVSEALAVGAQRLTSMPLDALVLYAQTAANEAEVAHLAAAADAAKARSAEDDAGRLSETFQAMDWEVKLRKGEAAKVAKEVDEADVLASTSVPQMVLGARAFLKLGDATQTEKFIARAVELSESSGHVADVYMVAQLMMQAKRFMEAAVRYEQLTPLGSLSELHTSLLVCYLRLGLRAKARELLSTFPPGWPHDRVVRHLAMELGQEAGDWSLLESLVAPQLEDQREDAQSWMFALMVAAHRDESTLNALAAQMPEILKGSIRELTQAASAEFQHGQVDKGLRRLYRMRRQNLGSTDAAAALQTAIALAPNDLAPLHEDIKVVRAGSSVQFTDPTGEARWKTIDPEEMIDLPSSEEFVKPDSAEAKVLMGRRVGETFKVQSGFGGELEFTVTAVVPAVTRLLTLSGAALKAPVAPSRHLTNVEIARKDDGQLDLAPMLRQLQKKEQSANRLFEHYQAESLTLGMVARLLGADAVDLVRDWPNDGPLLQVGGGTRAERDEAADHLSGTRRLLIDLSALTELALVKQLDLLIGVQRPLVSAATRDAVLYKLAEARVLKPMGTAFARHGKFHLVEYTTKSRAQRDESRRDSRRLVGVSQTIISDSASWR